MEADLFVIEPRLNGIFDGDVSISVLEDFCCAEDLFVLLTIFGGSKEFLRTFCGDVL